MDKGGCRGVVYNSLNTHKLSLRERRENGETGKRVIRFINP